MINYHLSQTKIRQLTLAVILSAITIIANAGALQERITTDKNSSITAVIDSAEYVRLVIKFEEGSAVELVQSTLSVATDTVDVAKQNEIEEINNLLTINGLTIKQLFKQDKNILKGLKKSGEEKSRKELADLTLYFEVPIGSLSKNDLRQLVNKLNQYSLVEIAYPEPEAEPASITPLFQNHDPENDQYQGYLDPTSQSGIDAKYAWTIPGGKGDTVKLVDIEGAWNLTHEDMPVMSTQLGTMTPDLSWRNHGTAVLGIIGGIENEYGITGIAPNMQLGYSSVYNSSTASAITAAANSLSPGDIILIELHSQGPTYQDDCECNDSQCNYVAMEYWQSNFDAIQTATANGIIVVEAAGNGSADLDDDIYNNLFKREYRDSGAIMVGGSNSTARSPMCWTNYGSRIDVHGWGENVTSTGFGSLYVNQSAPGDEDYWYTGWFNGTSSASPIVVGAVGAIQGVSKANKGETLTPSEARNILKITGTPQTGQLEKQIGPLPDLKKAIDYVLYGFQCQEYTTANSLHASEGRAYTESSGWWWITTTTWYTSGSDESLGTSGSLITTVHEPQPGYFAKGECPEQDITPPVITLAGDNPMTVSLGAAFQDPGASAIDNVDGDISSQIIVTGSVNTNQVGTYLLYYNVSDTAGNPADEVIRTVNVVAAPACQEYTSTVSVHTSAGRAYSESSGWWWVTTTTWYATGSDDNLGTSGTAIRTLRELPAGSGYFELGSCPVGPQPPSIDSWNVTVFADDFAIEGTASDPDNDIEHIYMTFGTTTIECMGSTNWMCVKEGVSPGTWTASIKAVDSGMRESPAVEVTVVIEPPQAPDVTIETVTVLGDTLRVTGTVTDINHDVIHLNMGLPGPYVVDCPIAENFICEADIAGISPGTRQGNIAAYDSLSQSDIEYFDFTVTESHAPVIESFEWYLDGITLHVNGTASDEDGDLEGVILSGNLIPMPWSCSYGADEFECIIDLGSGEYSLYLNAFDSEDNLSEPAGPIEFTIEEIPTCITATNYSHVQEGRAHTGGLMNLYAYANGSEDNLGLYGSNYYSITTSIEETSPDYWEKVDSCP